MAEPPHDEAHDADGPDRPDGPDDPEANAAAEAKARKPRRRLLLTAAAACWTIAVLALGAAGGYELFNRTAVHSAGDIVVRNVRAPSPKVLAAASVMPDLEGLTRDNALLAVADAGIDPGAVVFAERPNAATAGTVVAQSPIRGTRRPKRVSLTLAVAATVPDLTGKTTAEATAALQQLGAQATVVQTYDPAVPVDRVIASDPATGAPLTTTVTIQVSASASSIYLADVRTSKSSCSIGSAEVGSNRYANSLLCQARESATYALAGHADALTGSVGIDNQSKTGATAHVDVLADGNPIAQFDLTSGQEQALSVVLKGLNNLEIRVTSGDGATVVFGDARLIGSPTGIDALDQASP